MIANSLNSQGIDENLYKHSRESEENLNVKTSEIDSENM